MSFTEIIKESLLPLRASVMIYVALYVLMAAFSKVVFVTAFSRINASVHAFLLTIVFFFVFLIIRISRLSRIPSARRTLGDRRTLSELYSRNLINPLFFTLGFAPLVIWQFKVFIKLLILEYSSSTTIQSITPLVSQLATCSLCVFFLLFLYMSFDGISGDNVYSLTTYDSNYSEEEIRKIVRQELETREGERSHHS
jgi:predicted PurR-regulated permease PerM